MPLGSELESSSNEARDGPCWLSDLMWKTSFKCRALHLKFIVLSVEDKNDLNSKCDEVVLSNIKGLG